MQVSPTQATLPRQVTGEPTTLPTQVSPTRATLPRQVTGEPTTLPTQVSPTRATLPHQVTGEPATLPTQVKTAANLRGSVGRYIQSRTLPTQVRLPQQATGPTPSNVSIDYSPAVDEACIDNLPDGYAVVVGAEDTQQAYERSGPSAPCELAAGIESCRWFDELEQDAKLSVLRHGLDVLHEASFNLPRQAGGPGYQKWMRIGMALARSGIVDAEDLWVEWNRRVPDADHEEHLSRQFASFGTDGPIGVGTFIKIAAECGADFSSYKSLAAAANISASQQIGPQKSLSLHQLSAPNWAEVDRYGNPKPGYRNAKVAASALGIAFKHDTFHGHKTIGGHAIGRFAGEITDDAICALRDLIIGEFGFDPGKEHVVEAANALCIENSHDPVCDWLHNLQWDGQARLDTWLIDHAGVLDTPLNRAIGALLLVVMVRRAQQPGCKFDIMVVLEGPQGCGKSSLLLALAGAHEDFTDAPLLSNDVKTVAEALRGKWVAEISELAGLRRSEVERCEGVH